MCCISAGLQECDLVCEILLFKRAPQTLFCLELLEFSMICNYSTTNYKDYSHGLGKLNGYCDFFLMLQYISSLEQANESVAKLEIMMRASLLPAVSRPSTQNIDIISARLGQCPWLFTRCVCVLIHFLKHLAFKLY